jgi:hypothetical protein
MAKHAFVVEDGIIPGHNASSIGHTNNKFQDLNMSGDANIDGTVTVGEAVTATGLVTGSNVTEEGGGGGGGGVSAATAIAYSIALG